MSFEEGRDASGGIPRVRRGTRLVAVLVGAALVALHMTPASVVFGAAGSGASQGARERLYLGWIPPELLYRLVWMALAFAYLTFLASTVWRAPGPEGAPPAAGAAGSSAASGRGAAR